MTSFRHPVAPVVHFSIGFAYLYYNYGDNQGEMTKLANMDIFHELLMRSWNPVDVRSDRAAACKMHAFFKF